MNEIQTKHNPLFLHIEQDTTNLVLVDKDHLKVLEGQAKAWETVFNTLKQVDERFPDRPTGIDSASSSIFGMYGKIKRLEKENFELQLNLCFAQLRIMALKNPVNIKGL
jgi:hypothetical protein